MLTSSASYTVYISVRARILDKAKSLDGGGRSLRPRHYRIFGQSNSIIMLLRKLNIIIFDTQNMFMNFEVTSAKELTLGADQELSKAHRLDWNVENSGKTNGSEYLVIIET